MRGMPPVRVWTVVCGTEQKEQKVSEFDSGCVQDEDWDELVCEECKTCKYYQNQQCYCAGDEEPCKNRSE